MPVQSVNGVPCRFSAGDSLDFSIALSGYSSATYGLTFILNKLGAVGLTITGTANPDGSFQVTQTAAQTAGLAPGRYQWAAYATLGSTRALACSPGQISVQPNFAVAAIPTTAETLLAACDAALLALATSKRQSVSFNGQSYSSFQIKDLREMRDSLRAQVAAEQRAAGYNPQSGAKTIVTQFA